MSEYPKSFEELKAFIKRDLALNRHELGEWERHDFYFKGYESRCKLCSGYIRIYDSQVKKAEDGVYQWPDDFQSGMTKISDLGRWGEKHCNRDCWAAESRDKQLREQSVIYAQLREHYSPKLLNATEGEILDVLLNAWYNNLPYVGWKEVALDEVYETRYDCIFVPEGVRPTIQNLNTQ